MPAKMGDHIDPEETKIEERRKALKIPTPDDFKTEESRKALYRLNMKNASKNDTATDLAKKQKAENIAKPFSFKKGGMVQKGGMAKVHSGELVLTKAEARKDPRGKKVSCKR